MRRIKTFSLFVLLCAGLLSLQSCTAAYSARKEGKKARIQEKKAQFKALYEAASSNALQKGMSRQDIESAYGTPDSVYRASSGISSTQILTYEPLEDSDSDEARPIRLYFDSERLVTWSN